MTDKIFFMALGGAQRVGASCYYLRLGNMNLLLDAGTGKNNQIVFSPDFYALLRTSFMQSMSQLNQIYISHAHTDHVGALPYVMQEAGHANVYMTEITALLSEYQLYDRAAFSDSRHGEQKRLAIQNLFSRITPVSYMKTLQFENYQVQFFPAGHIPGAMMMLFQYHGRNILYTGDYSLDRTALTEGCLLPENIRIDTLIMCGLHAKHPHYIRNAGNELEQKALDVIQFVRNTGRSILCSTGQLSKGIEFLSMLNMVNQEHVPIYIDASVMKIVEKMERLSIPVMNNIDNYIMGDDMPEQPHIYLTAEASSNWQFLYHENRMIDFSLHEDFAQMKKLIKRINPAQAILVHCAPPMNVFDDTIEQELLLDGECRTQCIFAEESEIYQL